MAYTCPTRPPPRVLLSSSSQVVRSWHMTARPGYCLLSDFLSFPGLTVLDQCNTTPPPPYPSSFWKSLFLEAPLFFSSLVALAGSYDERYSHVCGLPSLFNSNPVVFLDDLLLPVFFIYRIPLIYAPLPPQEMSSVFGISSLSYLDLDGVYFFGFFLLVRFDFFLSHDFLTRPSHELPSI